MPCAEHAGQMQKLLLLLAAAGLGLSGCFDISTSSSDDAGAAPASTTDIEGGTPPATATGAGCATSAESGATLCTAISICPSLVVDHDVFPDCGFRIQGQTLDLECDCNGALCPIGVPVTCTEAAQLLQQQQSETNVCTQVSEGRCTPGAPPPAPTSTSTCDTTCRDECGGNPSCWTACGC
jgi:hypothetical protein